jgi:putative phosphoesterase
LRLAIISDTHLPRGTRALPLEHLRGADAIVHAGDLSTAAVLDELLALGPPIVAVHGNVDDAAVRARLPERVVFDAGGGVEIGVIHDAGAAKGRLARMRAAFPGCAAVVFGHSHIPLHETGDDGFQIFNPGSPTDRRRSPCHTLGYAEVDGGVVSFELVALD